jgi:hypothetical protein
MRATAKKQPPRRARLVSWLYIVESCFSDRRRRLFIHITIILAAGITEIRNN